MGDVAPRIHVNVSAQSLRSPNLPELLERTTRSDTALAHRIGFEVDGRELAGEAGRELATLGELRSLGARVVLDGFAGDDPALAEVAAWAPSMVKLSATDQERRVTAGLVRAVSSIRVATCIADLDEPGALDAAVAMGAYAGQGQALTGVRDIERIHRQLHAAPRIGF